MKFFITILALCLIGNSFTAQGTCATASYCMGCVDDAATCNSCFNWGKGTVGARYLASAACANKISTNAVTDCKYYYGGATATKMIHDCMQCNSKDWANVTYSAVAASIVNTCSNTAINTTTCASTVSNCAQSLCYGTASSAVVGCSQCKSGYVGSGTAIGNSTIGHAACVASSIANSAIMMNGSTVNVYTCKSGYAVASANSTTCTAFTTDSNCRKLSSTWCGECWHSYYFNAKVCVLNAQLIALSGLALVVLAFFN